MKNNHFIKPIYALLYSALLFPLVFFSQNTYYVSERNGIDTNEGSQAFPLKTINRASSLSKPGDTVLVLPGTYSFDDASNPWDNIFISNSGLPDQYITYKGISDEFGNKPKIISASNACFTIYDKSYIIIDNFEVTTVAEDINNVIDAFGLEKWRQRVGFNIVQNSHHIIVRNCYVHDFRGNGFQCGNSDVILLENNIVEHNAFHSNNGNSGISMYQMKDIDVPNFPEFPEHRLIIKNNISRYNVNLRGFIGFENKMTDGNGIIVDDLRHLQGDKIPYTGRTLVIGNITYGNGGMGINIYSSDHVDVYNNTMYDNAQTTRISNPPYEVAIGDAQLQIGDADDVEIKNNILINSARGNTLNRFNLGNSVVYTKNIHWNSLGAIDDNIDPNDMVVDPLLKEIEELSASETVLLATMTKPFDENSPSAMLREPTVLEAFKKQNVFLSENSPAIDTGENHGFIAYEGNGVDIGALEYDEILSTPELSDPSGFISIYPNPASSFLKLSIKKTDNFIQKTKLSVTDLLGNTVVSKTIQPYDANVFIDTKNWSSGIYLVILENTYGGITKKIIIE